MSLQDVTHAIESHKFAAEVNFASGTSAFHRAVHHHPLVCKLLQLSKEPGAVENILQRIGELSKQPVQYTRENPFDAALAVYLIALDLFSPEVARRGAEIISRIPNCWWAAEMSRSVQARFDPWQEGASSYMPTGAYPVNPTINNGRHPERLLAAILRNTVATRVPWPSTGVYVEPSQERIGSGPVRWQRELQQIGVDYVGCMSGSGASRLGMEAMSQPLSATHRSNSNPT